MHVAYVKLQQHDWMLLSRGYVPYPDHTCTSTYHTHCWKNSESELLSDHMFTWQHENWLQGLHIFTQMVLRNTKLGRLCCRLPAASPSHHLLPFAYFLFALLPGYSSESPPPQILQIGIWTRQLYLVDLTCCSVSKVFSSARVFLLRPLRSKQRFG